MFLLQIFGSSTFGRNNLQGTPNPAPVPVVQAQPAAPAQPPRNTATTTTPVRDRDRPLISFTGPVRVSDARGRMNPTAALWNFVRGF